MKGKALRMGTTLAEGGRELRLKVLEAVQDLKLSGWSALPAKS
jgi:hypothetical protein